MRKLGKRSYTKRNDFLKWLVGKADDKGIIDNPVKTALTDGFLRVTAERFLRILINEKYIEPIENGLHGRERDILAVKVKSNCLSKVSVVIRRSIVNNGFVSVGSDGGVIDKTAHKENIISDIPLSTDTIKEKYGVVVVFDYDNTSLSTISKRGHEIDVPTMYDAVIRYANDIGRILKKEAYITTSTEDKDFVIKNFFSLDKTPVIIVPPQKDAADEKMIESIEFSLMIPELKAVIIVSDDNKAFGISDNKSAEDSVCEKIKKAGCEAHIVTTGFISPVLASASTKVVNLFNLIEKIESPKEGAVAKNRFINIVKKMSLGVCPMTKEEKFVMTCFERVREMTCEPGKWFNFYRLYEGVWLKMNEQEKNSFSLDDCRFAIESLITIGMIRKGMFSFGSKNSVGYFVR
ncbi:MAG: hypothetical protein US71_C0002G0011 [Parcubacteria group bacterium GW2011_GWD2_38_12]|nr:MAG: hypothetical protein US06_C0003G0047 [Parcubacteria group bacterium GW2011_GWC2_36_17]KKQ43739.1 MAG: hypothetical protein US61_C0004G0008 [Parcubacteria group bacterium GW2011_GWE2_37_8]KKQ52614.1 MAG: hypothetical protein US71_C0002G0011 [Parcubacteria group bacterium GW2011_GWD2_38_12]KKQ58866.1 MAG: hypothetical protein US79_C0002G0054 [Parcubacteria group bacterium GW2011_GWC1_38_17]KKQ59567.1 MAG: hypothetical protein US78_C0002G0030 [Parcubacteria group bacterium GW2011_GWD1_38_1